MTDLNSTPRADRVHIGFFGRRNSGKSSLINNLANQEVTIVSEQPGTTTDPVLKAIELPKLGPCVLQDTAGFDDEGELGQLRVGKSRFIAEKTDIAVILIPADLPESELNTLSQEKDWLQSFQKRRLPVILAVSKADRAEPERVDVLIKQLTPLLPERPDFVLKLNNRSAESVAGLREKLCSLADALSPAPFITGGLVKAGDTVLLVMPQDIQAPQGRLILPQVQTIRELLDRGAFPIASTADNFPAVLEKLSQPPDLIITDSQVFAHVYAHKPQGVPLTSFSVLFAAYKGDLPYYLQGAKASEALNENSRVLIAECCSHVPLNEDIGRVKLPRLLKKKLGEGLNISVAGGQDFPADLTPYDLIIQCGACMFNRQHVLSRIQRAKDQKVPMTNYGIIIAKLHGILDKIALP